jgi:2,4-dienoyl-CoA reductase (NADPH2)
MQALLYGNRRKITIIDIVERLADNAGRSSRWVLMKNLRLAGVESRLGTKLVEITDDAVIVETAEGRESIVADTVIMAVGSKSLNHLAGEAGMAGVETVVIGDAKSPRKIAEAIREGFEEALKI